MRKKKILFATAYGANDTTSWLRAMGPFTLPNMLEVCEWKLPREMYDDKGNQLPWWINWSNWMDVDVCFLHRPYGPLAASIISNAKMHGVPVWVDHDDDLLNIPEHNPYFEIHSQAEKKFPGVLYSYKEADILTCSSKVMHEELKTRYKRPDAMLITTGLDDRFLRFKKPWAKNNKIGWRGSKTHIRDIRHREMDYLRLFKKYPDLEWYWFGQDPRRIFGSKLDGEINGEVIQQLNLFHFISELCNANCSLHLVPLEPSHFNKVKSNLSWLDATLAGSAVVAPGNDFPEWDLPGMIKWDCINEAIDSPSLQKQGHDWSWDYIKSELLTSKINKHRIEILRQL